MEIENQISDDEDSESTNGEKHGEFWWNFILYIIVNIIKILSKTLANLNRIIMQNIIIIKI